MSGPNDSGDGATPTSDFRLTLNASEPATLSPRFRLHLRWDTPRLEWRPTLDAEPPPHDKPEFLKLDDPFAAVLATERYILSGGLLFDMRRPRFDLVDLAFRSPPTEPPRLFPTFAEMKAFEDRAFFGRLGGSSPLLGAPAPPALQPPPSIGSAPPSPFFKPPGPPSPYAEAAPPKQGGFGDILKALHGLPIVQQNLDRLSDEALRQVRVAKTEWDAAPWRDRITAITIATPLAASVVATALGPRETRHFAFNLLKGVDLPVPWVPGLSLHIDDFGKADSFLLGAKPGDPQTLQFGLKLDVPKAFSIVGRALR